MAGVVFDSTFLIDLLNPRLQGNPRAALDYLISDLSKSKTRLLVPAPCLTELLIKADKARDAYLAQMASNSSIDVIPFDRRAATECALLLASAWDSKSKKAVTRTKFKFDWMIVACAVSRGAQCIYSDDDDIRRYALLAGQKVIEQRELHLPEQARQLTLPE